MGEDHRGREFVDDDARSHEDDAEPPPPPIEQAQDPQQHNENSHVLADKQEQSGKDQ